VTLLDNALWEALGSYHARFAQGAYGARRYLAEVSPLCGVRDTTDHACWSDLADLMGERERIGLLLWSEPDVGSDLQLLRSTPLVQMTFTGDPAALPPAESISFRDLTAADADGMIALVSLTKPGPMERRTVELGRYVGVHDDSGKLIAMTGERARLPGWTEVSAVCTHPDHRGKGLARQLMLMIMRDIVARNELPFLHVAAANTGAQQLYQTLGFTVRRPGVHVLVRRAR
jgi:ribosomal protein S18 acetylase RimI-like enzyme